MKKHDTIDAAAELAWRYFILAAGHLSLLAALPFMILGRMIKKGRRWL